MCILGTITWRHGCAKPGGVCRHGKTWHMHVHILPAYECLHSLWKMQDLLVWPAFQGRVCAESVPSLASQRSSTALEGSVVTRAVFHLTAFACAVLPTTCG